MVMFDDDEPVHLRSRSSGDYLRDPITGKPVRLLEGEQPHEMVTDDDAVPARLGAIGRLRRSLQRLWRPST